MTAESLSSSSIYDLLGVRRVINGAGPATRLGGIALDPRVVTAMQQASVACVRMEELHRRAGEHVARTVGTESALVTCGAGAGLVLAVAASITGYDVTAMNQLPEPGGLPHEVIMLRTQRYPYDRLARVAGGVIVEVGYREQTHLYDIERAICERTAAFLFYTSLASPGVKLPEIVAICHSHQIPVIVDAAMEALSPILDPQWIDAGADLIVFSGGKTLRGPQASGVLAGRKRLVEPAMLHMLDMDVHPRTWVERELIEAGVVPGSPYHGLGRALKVGKEEIAGLIAAIEIFASEDHAARAAHDMERLDAIIAGLPAHGGVELIASGNGAFAPRLTIAIDETQAGFTAWDLLLLLQERGTPVHLNEASAWEGKIAIDPITLLPGEELEVGAALAESLGVLTATARPV
jgi:L-seryl-tRNA(Ser) seleniumtransferase